MALFWPVRAGVTIALLTIIGLTIDWGQVRSSVGHGSPLAFAGAVLVLAVALIVGSLRWHLFLRSAGIRTSPSITIRVYFVGTFSNNFLPTAFGGDAARVALVGRNGNVTGAIMSVTVDRLTSIGCLVVVGALAVAIQPGAVPSELAVLMMAFAGCCIVVCVALVASLKSRRLVALVPARLRPAASLAREILLQYFADRRLLLVTIGLGLVYQLLAIVCTDLLGRSVGLDLPLALLAVVLPLVLAVTLIPVSIAGFGLREGGFVALLSPAGVAAGPATILSLLSVATLVLASLPGALALMATRPNRD